MKLPVTLVALTLMATGAAKAEIKTHSAFITLPDGARMHCWSVEGSYGSTTSCRPSAPRHPKSTAVAPRLEIEITPELEAAWDTAYRYIKKARTRKGWKTQVRGPLGDLMITEKSVALGNRQIARGTGEVEAAIWQLTRQCLGLVESDMKSR